VQFEIFEKLTSVCFFPIKRETIPVLGTGHKVTARVGWSDLGWAMEYIGAVSMGRQLFCMSTVGPPNKNRPYLLSSLIILNIIANTT
jgi:hypothetical protein